MFSPVYFSELEAQIRNYSRLVETNQLEIEARFGYFFDIDTSRGRRPFDNRPRDQSIKDFRSGVDINAFTRLDKELSKDYEAEVSQITDYREVLNNGKLGSNVKRIVLFKNKQTVTYLRKEALYRIGLLDYGIDVVISKEEVSKVPNFDERRASIRSKERRSYWLSNTIRVDLTKAIGDDQRTSYEVEIESKRINYLTSEDVNAAYGKVFSLMNGSRLIYTTSERATANRQLNLLVNNSPQEKYLISNFVESRPLKIPDIQFGGIVGNSSNIYTATHKVDGLRKLVLVTDTHMWMLWTTGGYNLLKRGNFTGFSGSILDGEFIEITGDDTNEEGGPISDNNNANSNSEYFYNFVPFDCLFYLSEDVRRLDHRERYDRANKLWQNLQNSGMNEVEVTNPLPETGVTPGSTTVSIIPQKKILGMIFKEFKQIVTVDDFYIATNNLLDQVGKTVYKIDGLVFTPEYAPYMPGSENIDLEKRTLVSYPDVCKWKPDITIDFYVLEVGTNGMKLGASDKVPDLTKGSGSRSVIVPFVGDRYNPFDPTQVDMQGELSKNAKVGQIIEFSWSDRTDSAPPSLQSSSQVQAQVISDDKDKISTEKKVKGRLVPVRLRPDREWPNRLDVALDDWRLIHDPITEDTIRGQDLTLLKKYHNKIKKGLFREAALRFTPRSDQAPRNVKGKKSKNVSREYSRDVIPRPVSEAILLDIGSGLGADVSKWSSFKRVLAVEPDKNKIFELTRRVRANGMQDKVTILQANGEDFVKIEDALRNIGKAHVISLMLSMSFFWESREKVDGLLETMRRCLRPDGIIIFLTINGDNVEQMFNPLTTGLRQNGLILGTVATISDISEEQGFNPIGAEYLSPKEIRVMLKKTIMGDQQDEFLVKIEDVLEGMPNHHLKYMYNAEDEMMMSNNERTLTSLYSYGLIEKKVMSDLFRSGVSGVSQQTGVIVPGQISQQTGVIVPGQFPQQTGVIVPQQRGVILPGQISQQSNVILPGQEPSQFEGVTEEDQDLLRDIQRLGIEGEGEVFGNIEKKETVGEAVIVNTGAPQIFPRGAQQFFPNTGTSTQYVPESGPTGTGTQYVPVAQPLARPLTQPSGQFIAQPVRQESLKFAEPGTQQRNIPVLSSVPILGLNLTGLARVGDISLPSFTGFSRKTQRAPLIEITIPRDQNTRAQGDGDYLPIENDLYQGSNDLVRIGALGGGDCFFHCLMQGMYPTYQQTPAYGRRVEMARKLRNELAVQMFAFNPFYNDPDPEKMGVEQLLEGVPNRPLTYYETAGKGILVELAWDRLLQTYTAMKHNLIVNLANFARAKSLSTGVLGYINTFPTVRSFVEALQSGGYAVPGLLEFKNILDKIDSEGHRLSDNTILIRAVNAYYDGTLSLEDARDVILRVRTDSTTDADQDLFTISFQDVSDNLEPEDANLFQDATSYQTSLLPLPSDIDTDTSFEAIRNLLASSRSIGDTLYSLISEILELNIYVLHLDNGVLRKHLSSVILGAPNGVVVVGEGTHFELIAVMETRDGKPFFNTVFAPDHPLTSALQ